MRDILRLGDPRLRLRSEPVQRFDTAELHQLVDDMTETMEAADGAGLAAIQIAVPLRVMIFGFETNARYPEVAPIPFTVLVNPDYTVVDEQKSGGWEGCLSVPGMRGFVTRFAAIQYRGCDQYGNEVRRNVEGFHARVFQHEYDHLNGVLYPDLIEAREKFGFCKELAAANAL